MATKVYAYIGFINGGYIGKSAEAFRTKEACEASMATAPTVLVGQGVEYIIIELELEDERSDKT